MSRQRLNNRERGIRMTTYSLTHLSPEQCWRIYSRLEEMTLQLAEYADIGGEELEKYFVPLCQEDEWPGELLGVNNKPRRIENAETIMWQFARSLQNSGRMSRAVDLDIKHGGVHERAFKNNHLLDVDYVCSTYGDGSSSDCVKKLASEICAVLGRRSNGYLGRYAKGLIEAANYLKNGGLNDINKAIKLKADNGTPAEMNKVANAIRQNVYGMGPALSRDFLKECGCIWVAKPDTHLVTVLKQINDITTEAVVNENFDPEHKVRDANQFCEVVYSLAMGARSKAGEGGQRITPYRIDKMIWLICTGNFYLEDKSAEQEPQGDGVHSHRDILIRYLNKTGAA